MNLFCHNLFRHSRGYINMRTYWSMVIIGNCFLMSTLNNVVYCVNRLCSSLMVFQGDHYAECLIYHNRRDCDFLQLGAKLIIITIIVITVYLNNMQRDDDYQP